MSSEQQRQDEELSANISITPRHRAREFVIEVLYEVEISDRTPFTVFQRRLDEQRTNEHGVEDIPLTETSIEFAQKLLTGVVEKQFHMNRLITQYAPEWPLAQIAVLDRNILSLAMYEMIYDQKTPIKVVINEAVELAKAYASDNSPRFVNGVLGSFADDLDMLRETINPIDSVAPIDEPVTEVEVVAEIDVEDEA